MINIPKEDYLSTIYKNCDNNGEIKANIIAEKLQISNAAVTDMLKKLAKEKLIIYEPYKLVRFTPKGEELAKNIVRRHRIWEIFLHQIVGLPWDKVHDEAEKLEHSGSDELIDRMEAMCDFPSFDPHGDPIPQKNGKIPRHKKSVPLSELKKNQKGKVIRVSDFNKEFLNYLTELGIGLDETILVQDIRSFDNSLLIKIKGKSCNISNKLADNVFVEIIKN